VTTASVDLDEYGCPGVELEPNPCTCKCWGCKFHCAAHNPDDMADEDTP
jgi:hypothetical protein